jgi:ArsR family transcriptional regulator, cadmium/lead-responsive transcriptional repressor
LLKCAKRHGSRLSACGVIGLRIASAADISMHLGCLADCGLVARERQGKFVVYHISDRRVLKLLGQIDELLSEVGGFIATCARYGRPERWPAGRAAGSQRCLTSARSR